MKNGEFFLNPCVEDYEAHLETDDQFRLHGRTKAGEFSISNIGLNRPSCIRTRRRNIIRNKTVKNVITSMAELNRWKLSLQEMIDIGGFDKKTDELLDIIQGIEKMRIKYSQLVSSEVQTHSIGHIMTEPPLSEPPHYL